MNSSAPTSTPAALRGSDGLAVIGRTLHDLRGIRLVESDGGGAPAPAAPEGPAVPEPKPTEPPAPAEVDWKAKARQHEDREKEWKAKATENEAAARRLKEIEDEQKTEAQKTQERLDAAEKRALEAETRALIADVAASKGVPAALLPKSGTKEELEAAADLLIEFQGAKPPVGAHLPNQDKSPQKPASSLAETTRKIFGG